MAPRKHIIKDGAIIDDATGDVIGSVYISPTAPAWLGEMLHDAIESQHEDDGPLDLPPELPPHLQGIDDETLRKADVLIELLRDVICDPDQEKWRRVLGNAYEPLVTAFPRAKRGGPTQ